MMAGKRSQPIDNEKLEGLGIILKRSGLVDPPTKQSSFDRLDEADVTKVATAPKGEDTNVVGGTHKATLAPGKDSFYGTGGAETCVAVMMILPEGKGYVIFHFTTEDDAAGTLSEYKWPKGTKAVVVGGNAENPSRWLLAEIVSYLKRNEIKSSGVRTAQGIWVGSDGKIYVLDNK